MREGDYLVIEEIVHPQKVMLVRVARLLQKPQELDLVQSVDEVEGGREGGKEGGTC